MACTLGTGGASGRAGPVRPHHREDAEAEEDAREAVGEVRPDEAVPQPRQRRGGGAGDERGLRLPDGHRQEARPAQDAAARDPQEVHEAAVEGALPHPTAVSTTLSSRIYHTERPYLPH